MEKQLKRQSLLMDARAAAANVEDGMTVSIGGFLNSSHPMALVREIIKRGVKNLTLMPAVSASLDADLLIGAGCVKKIVTAYCGAEDYAPICPLFRAFAEQGKLEVWECDESHYYSALKAAALELPFFPDRAGVGTDLPKVNPDLKLFNDPIKGEPLLAVPPIRPDVTLLYAAYADIYGNVQPVGSAYGDRMHWIACEKLFVQVEKIVHNQNIRTYPERTAYFLDYKCDGVIRAPYGSHPFAGPGFYIEDGSHIREYLAAAEDYAKKGNRATYDAYLKKYVFDPETHIDYLEAVGVKRLMSINEDVNTIWD